MSIIKTVDFSSGTFSECSSIEGTPSIVTAPVFNSNYAAKINFNGDAINYLESQSLSLVAIRQWCRIDAIPVGAPIFGMLRFSDGIASSVVNLLDTGGLQVQSDLTVVGEGDGEYLLSPNIWYEVIFAMAVAAGGLLKAWIRSEDEYNRGIAPTLTVSCIHIDAGNNIEVISSKNEEDSGTALYADTIAISNEAELINDQNHLPFMSSIFPASFGRL